MPHARRVSIKQSISTKLLVVVFSIYMAVMILVTAIHMYITYEREHSRISDELSRFQQMIEPALAKAFLNQDNKQIYEVLQDVLYNRALIGIAITSNDPAPKIWQQGYVYDWQQDTLYTHLREYTHLSGPGCWVFSHFYQPMVHSFPLMVHDPVTNALVLSAEVSLYSDTDAIVSDITLSFFTIIICALIMTITLWVFLLWAGYHYLTKPLRILTFSLISVSQGQFTDVKVKVFGKGETEIDLLARAFNTMVDKVTLAQQTLTQTRRHLLHIIDAMPSVLIGITPTGIVTDWNVQTENLTGVMRQMAVGAHYAKVMPFLEKYQSYIAQALLNRQHQKTPNTLFVLGGENRYFDVVIYSLEEQEGYGAVIRLDDVTAQHQLQELVVQTEKMTSIGRLAAGMAHEINNPLGVILQNIQNITRRLDPQLPKNQEEAQKIGLDFAKLTEYFTRRDINNFFTSIRDAGERAAKIVANLLRFSRQSSSALLPSRLTDIIEKAIELVLTDYELKEQLDLRPIQIEREYKDDLPMVWCEPAEIQQVVMNLLKNAAQAMLGQLLLPSIDRIIVRTYYDENWAYIEIEDNGPGMPEHIRKRIFEPFLLRKKSVKEQV